MFKKVNGNELLVLSLFTNGFNQEFYVREVASKTKVSLRTAHLVLKSLEQKGILHGKTRGKIKLFSLKQNPLVRENILFTEQFKKINFYENYPIESDILDKVKEVSTGPLILFGSYAKGIQKSSSDIDLLCLGSVDLSEVSRIEKLFNHEINVKVYPLKKFKEKYFKDFLLIEVLKSHILIRGGEEVLEMIFYEQN